MNLSPEFQTQFIQMIAQVKQNVFESIRQSVNREIDAQARALFGMLTTEVNKQINNFKNNYQLAHGSSIGVTPINQQTIAVNTQNYNSINIPSTSLYQHHQNSTSVFTEHENSILGSQTMSPPPPDDDDANRNDNMEQILKVELETDSDCDCDDCISIKEECIDSNDDANIEPVQKTQMLEFENQKPSFSNAFNNSLNDSTRQNETQESLLEMSIPGGTKRKRRTKPYNPEEDSKARLITLSLACINDSCNQTFTDKHQLAKHLEDEHKMLKCQCPHSNCGRSFHLTKQLNDHFQVEHPLAEWRCIKCGVKMQNYHCLNVHMYKFHHTGLFQCSQTDCTYTSNNRQAIYCHIDNQHSRRNCDMCGKSFSSSRLLRRHQHLLHTNIKQ